MSMQVDKLAATLKSAGLCASVYDARNMAESITSGVSQKQQDMEIQIARSISSGTREERPHPLFKPVSAQAGAVRTEPDSFIAQKLEEKPAYRVEEPTLSFEEEECDVDICLDDSEEAGDFSEDLQEFSQAEPVSSHDNSYEEVNQEEESDSLSIFGDDDVSVEQAAPEEVARPVPAFKPVETVAEPAKPAVAANKPQEINSATIEAMKKACECPPQPQYAPAAPQAPKRELVRGKTIYEIEQDPNRPKVKLTEQEMKDTDITKWFNFANR